MKVAAFYRFLDVADPASVCEDLQQQCNTQKLRGTILVAAEGINGTIAGSLGAIHIVFGWLEECLALQLPIEAHWTEASEVPFRRMRVRLKKEIVSLGRPDLRPHEQTGVHVSPAEWNRLLDNPDLLLIDARNHYETELGSFPGAIDPGTDSFREFPAFSQTLPQTSKASPIAMFCTGGIRCEKAAALMLELGFEEVYQLRGGILNYLSEAPSDNRWSGECFVFDERVAVDRDLAEGAYVQCHACRRPLTFSDLQSPDYQERISCPHCIDDCRP